MELPHRWSLDCNYLLGLTFGEWLHLLRDNSFEVAPAYLHRAAAITGMSLYNSAMSRVQRAAYGRRIDEASPRPPLIILGHWRSGTTFLYQLLSSDPGVCFPNEYQVVNPHHFLVTEPVGARVFRPLVPATRPPDQVAMGFHLPEQDEYTIALATGCSPYIGHVFPRRAEHYERYVTFRDVPVEERRRVVGALRELVSTLAVKYDRPVVLKSPAHTARIPLLLQAFPDAKFVFIRRNPYDVYLSTLRLYETLHWYWYLQEPDPESFKERILRRYEVTHGAYLEDRERIPAGNLAEISFEELESAPIPTLERVYETLSWSGFEAARPHFQAHLDGVREYQRNRHPELDEATRRMIADRWAPFFSCWGYAP